MCAGSCRSINANVGKHKTHTRTHAHPVVTQLPGDYCRLIGFDMARGRATAAAAAAAGDAGGGGGGCWREIYSKSVLPSNARTRPHGIADAR